MKIHVFFVFVLISFRLSCQGKEQVDFEPNKNYSQKYIDSVITGLVKTDIPVFKKMLSSNKNLQGWVRYYQRMASVASKKEEFDSVIYHSNRAIKTFNDSRFKRPLDERFLVAVYSLRAYAFRLKKDYKKAINDYQKALDLEKKYPYKWKSYITGGIGSCHVSLGNDSLAVRYFLKVVNDSIYMSVARAGVSTLFDIGTLYRRIGDFDQAEKYLIEGLKYSYKEKHYNNLTALNGEIGFIKYKQDSINRALSYFKRAIEAENKYGIGSYLGAEEDHLLFTGFVNVHEGDLYQGIDELEQAISGYENFEKISKPTNHAASFTFEVLGNAYLKSGNYISLVLLNKRSNLFLERFYETQLQEDLQNLEIQYQTKEKDASIAQLEQNEEQQQTIIKQQRYLAFGLGGLLVLLSGFGYLFWKQRKLKNQYEKENLEQRLLRSQMNPHFIGNAMNTISALVERKSEETIPFINKLSNLFRLMLTNSREEFVSLGEELMIIRSYLELQSNFSNRFEFNISTDQNEDLEEILVPPMLIQPLVENAIIHGLSNKNEDGEITVHVAKDIKENLLKVTVNDNGNGFDKSMLLNPNQNKKSISGNIVKERIEILKKKFKVNTRLTTNSSSKGTKVELYLPYIVDV